MSVMLYILETGLIESTSFYEYNLLIKDARKIFTIFME